MHLRPLFLSLFFLGFSLVGLQADVRLPHVIGDHMVLQREKPVPIWGWADPGEAVTVTFAGKSAKATADDKGKWMVKLDAMPANAVPSDLVVAGKNEVRVKNVLVGEVWLCSGQSNMEWTVSRSLNVKAEVAAANWPLIRHIKMPKQPASEPVEDRVAKWEVCSPATVANFTAAGYFFGRKLHQELDVPIGLLNASWGGTRIEPWVPAAGFEGIEKLKSIHELVTKADPLLANRKPPQQQPTTLYNGMIHPLVPFALRGAIWYQGESNRVESDYTEKTQALLAGWRGVWNEPELPYYLVQIAPFQYGAENPHILPRFWEQQAAIVKTIPHTGMVVINDIGNLKDIHPKNKQDVGDRLAGQALAQTYGKTDLVFSGPRYREMKLEGTTIRVGFDYVGGGLVARDGKPLSHWEICGEGTGWKPAEATTDGKTVLVKAESVAKPMHVRYAWHKLAVPNLMNKEGLPAGPFRSGEPPQPDMLSTHFKDAAEHQLVYEMNLENLSATPVYDVNESKRLAGTKFSQVTYFLELQKSGGPVEYVRTSMDAFTDDLGKLGIPTVASGAIFQQTVKNLRVSSNVEGVANGENLEGGYLEFWPNNYEVTNGKGVEGASNEIYDFGDNFVEPVAGYGSMQVHNTAAKQTVFAINAWKVGGSADIGIGNSAGKTRDWTFTKSGAGYSLKRLRIFVK